VRSFLAGKYSADRLAINCLAQCLAATAIGEMLRQFGEDLQMLLGGDLWYEKNEKQ